MQPKEGPLCLECPLYSSGIPVDDILPVQTFSGLTLVGEMPGRTEVQKGIPFVGQSGSIIRPLIAQAGTRVDNLHITNCIRCGLKGSAKLSDKQGQAAMECCRPLLLENLYQMNPKVVCCVGAVPWESLSGLKGIDKYRGTVIRPNDKQPWILTSTIHPAGLLRVESRRPYVDLLFSDIKKAYQLASNQIEIWNPNIIHPGDLPKILQFLNTVKQKRLPVSCDIETDGIEVYGTFSNDPCNLVTIGLSAFTEGQDEPIATSIPWPTAYPDFFSKKEAETLVQSLKQLLDDPDQTLVFHNKPFDVPVLRRVLKIDVRAQCEDTLLLDHVVYPRCPHTLQQVTSKFFPVEAWKDIYKNSETNLFKYAQNEDSEESEDFDTTREVVDLDKVSLDELLYYNACDAGATIKIYRELLREAEEMDVLTIYKEDSELVDYTLDWSYDGIGIDMNLRHELEIKYSKLLEEQETNLREVSCLESGPSLAGGMSVLVNTLNIKSAEYRQLGRILTILSKHNGVPPKSSKLEDIQCLHLYQDEGLDYDILKLRYDNLKLDIADLKTQIKNYNKIPTKETFKLGSPAHILAILMQRGLNPSKVTDKGNISVSQDSLWDLRDDPFVGGLFKWRTYSKLYSTYIKNLKAKMGTDYRIHPTWKLHSTPSGRFGTTPSVQNWPSDMKQLMIASEGCSIVGIDYAALELRIAALLGDEPEWIKIFLNDGDLHALMAEKYFPEFRELNKQWFAVSGTDKDRDKAIPRRKELRGRGKNITFGDIYLAGAQTLYEQVREKLDDVKTREEHLKLKMEVALMQKVLRAATPNRVEFARLQLLSAKQNQYLRVPYWKDQYGVEHGGRIRSYPGFWEPNPNEVANHPIQGMAASIMNAATLRLVRKLKQENIYRDGAWIILQIHDALYIEALDELAEHVKQLMEECLYTEIHFTSPVTHKTNMMRFTAEAYIAKSVGKAG